MHEIIQHDVIVFKKYFDILRTESWKKGRNLKICRISWEIML